MPLRQPLVLGADGLPQQLQPGDTITSNVSTTSVRSVINGETTALAFGTPVYTSAADTVKRGQANAKATGKIIGLMFDPTTAAGANGNIATDGILIGTTAQWDAITGQTGGLTFNSTYFLDPATAGRLTTTPPTTAGQVNVLIGTAISTTALDLEIQPPILL